MVNIFVLKSVLEVIIQIRFKQILILYVRRVEKNFIHLCLLHAFIKDNPALIKEILREAE